MRKFLLSLFLTGILVLCAACPGKLSPITPPTDNTSVSEVGEALVSGTVNATYTTGTQGLNVPKVKKPISIVSEMLNGFLLNQPAWAQRVATGICPSVQSGGVTCIISANSMTLPLPVCNYPNQAATVTWSGNETITNSGTTPVNCTSFPPFTSGDSLLRTFSTPTTRMEPSWLIVLLDTSESVAGVPPVTASGITISYSGPVARTILINGIHVAASISGYLVWNYVVTSNSINVDATNTVTAGTITIQDLVLQRTDTITISNLTYVNGICTPATGAVSTTFSDHSPTETLTFTGNNGATLNGNPITLNHCW